MTMNYTTRQIVALRRLFAGGLVASSFFAAGCATPWEKMALMKDTLPSIDRIQGPTQRSLRNLMRQKQDDEDEVAGGPLKPIKGTPEYLAAVELFKEEKYEEARKAFKKVAKTYKKSEIREDALFMQAESAWQQEHYSAGHDAYAILLKEYPSTRHLNVVSERMFKLGRMWLDFPEVAKLGEIKQVNFEEPGKPLPPEEKAKQTSNRSIVVPNFTDKKEPWFDTAGNGVAALRSVWMNDPTGPLADDAMMLVASYYARTGDYVEADRYFQNLRELYPNSPHVQNAFILGSHVKVMSYQGPAYESRTLQEAQLLKESTLRLYENLPSETRERITTELARIEDSKAEIIWKQAEFWHRKDNKRAAAIYCHQVISEYPKSRYATQALTKLAEMGPEYESGAIFLTSRDKKKSAWLEWIDDPMSYKWPKYKSGTAAVAQAKRTGSSVFSMARRGDKSDSRVSDGNGAESSDDAESTPGSDGGAKPRRRWLPFGSPPEKLPAEDTEDDIRQMSSSGTGRSRS